MKFSHCFLTVGTGNHTQKLISFELALRNAGIAPYNWIFVNSILPARCELVPKDEGLQLFRQHHDFGDPAYMVLSRVQTTNPNEIIFASIGASRYAIRGVNDFGYLAEYGYAANKGMMGAREHVEDTVTGYSRYMLHTLVGEAEIYWSSRDKDFEQIEKACPTITKSAVSSNCLHTNGVCTEWATAIACAILIPG